MFAGNWYLDPADHMRVFGMVCEWVSGHLLDCLLQIGG